MDFLHIEKAAFQQKMQIEMTQNPIFRVERE